MTSPASDVNPYAPSVERAPWFAALDAAQQALVRATTTQRSFAAGECVARAGEAASAWIGVASGFLRMSVIGADGSETTLHFLREGEWGGEGSLLKRELRRYDVVAVQASQVCLLPQSTFALLLAQNVAFNHFLLANLNERMGVITGLLEAARLLAPDLRVARCLSILTAGRPEAAVHMPQHELANLCGLSRQRTNVALRTLNARGMLSVEGQRICLTQPGALDAYAR